MQNNQSQKPKITFESDRLYFRPWQKNDEDINALIKGFDNRETAEMLLDIPFPFNKGDAEEYIDNTKKINNMGFAIVLKETDVVIGGTTMTIGFDSVLRIMTVDGHIWLQKEFQNKGYGTEAWAARENYCLSSDFCALDVVISSYYDKNIASSKMQSNTGFKQVKNTTEPHRFYPDSQEFPVTWTKKHRKGLVRQGLSPQTESQNNEIKQQ